jgi:tetratricopeptide (TPR) repeat protein
MAEKKFGEAEQVLDQALTPGIGSEPGTFGILAERVDLLGHQGRWPEAVADAALLLKYQPAEHYHYHILAALLVINHNRPDYEQLCQKILPLFINTTNPYIAERMACDCLLLPQSGADLQQVDRLATTAVTIGKDDPAIGYFQACKALSEYRLGRFPEAVAWAEKSVKTSPVFAHAKGCAVLAMAQWQLGQKAAARAALAEGNTLAPPLAPQPDTVDLGDSWVAWLFARISLDEAEALIRPASTAESDPHSRGGNNKRIGHD